MVVFTCNHCGDSLQKPKVAKHYQTTCRRNPISLTCVDCFKDFNLQEYVTHIKCVTEDQRYSAKGAIVKTQKGEVKQTEWVETVNTIIEQQQNAKPGIKNVLQAMADYTNIPRKKVKFINFMTSAFGNRFNKRDIEAVWDLLETHKEAQRKSREDETKQKSDESNGETKSQNNGESEETVENGASEKNAENGTSEETTENGTSEKKTKKKRKNKQANGGTTETEEIPEKKQKLDETNEDTSSSKKKKKKSKQPETEETPETNGTDTPAKTKKKKTSESNDETINSTLDESQNEKFSFKQVITDILTKKSKGLTKEALQNKVLKKYEAQMGPVENQETLLKKYNKKLKAMKNVACENEKYKIVSE